MHATTDCKTDTKRVPLTWKSANTTGPYGGGRVQTKRCIIISGEDVYLARILVEYKYAMRYGVAFHIGRIVNGLYVQDEYDRPPIYTRECTMAQMTNRQIEDEMVSVTGVTESYGDARLFYERYPAYGNSYNAVF